MNEQEKDNTKDAYSLTKYDQVYFILKPECEKNDVYKGIVKYDKARKKYFLTGKVVELEGYPKYQAVTLVPEKNIEEFKKAKRTSEKIKLLINVRFGHIEFITLPFDSLDWKK